MSVKIKKSQVKKCKYFIVKKSTIIYNPFCLRSNAFVPHQFLPYFGIWVRIMKLRVRTVFWFPYACREVDVTLAKTKTNFKSFVGSPKGLERLESHFVTDLYALENFLRKRNSNSCIDGFTITVDKMMTQIFIILASAHINQLWCKAYRGR